jgi:hypothetical protein
MEDIIKDILRLDICMDKELLQKIKDITKVNLLEIKNRLEK